MAKRGADDLWGGHGLQEVLRRALAELLGTLLLVAVGCMGCLAGWGSGAPPPMQSSLSFGLTVMFVVQIFGHVSGAHVNPSVTLASIIFGDTTVGLGAVYLAAQTVGAIAGYGLLMAVTPDKAMGAGFCVTSPHPDISATQAVLVEAVITAVLVLLSCAVWDPCNAKNSDSVPLKFGLMVAAIAMATGAYTGASMNPVRSLAPALWTNNWTNQWIYWVGPLLGSAVAALLYCNFFRREQPKKLREEVPLNEVNDKETGHVM